MNNESRAIAATKNKNISFMNQEAPQLTPNSKNVLPEVNKSGDTSREKQFLNALD